MGGGNGQKSATARARKEAADAKRNAAGACRDVVKAVGPRSQSPIPVAEHCAESAGSQLKQNAAAQNVVVCCLLLFMLSMHGSKTMWLNFVFLAVSNM